MANFTEVADQFVKFYYVTFDADRKNLGNLYRDNSMLTFETAQSLGTAAIVEKLTGLQFQKVQHQVATLDSQPGPNGSIIILITGQLLVDEEQNVMKFSQCFQLLQEGSSWYVFNDIFKLVYS